MTRRTNPHHTTIPTMMKKTPLALVAALLACTVAATAHAQTTEEPLEGVLEKGPAYSALFTVSEESGDLIGFAFHNQSKAGKIILQHCQPQKVCQIRLAHTRNMEPSDALQFADRPSGWFEITQVQGVRTVPNR